MFLLFSIIAFIFIGLTIEDRDKETRELSFGWPTIWLAAWILVSYFFARSEFLGLFIAINLLNLLMWFGGFLLIGLVWSFFKWLQFSKLRAKKWRIRLEEHKYEVGSEEYNSLKLNYTPYASDYIGKISGWIILWPFSIVSYIVGDLWDNLVMWFEKVYENITNSQFK